MIKLRRRPAFDFAVGDGELSGHEVDRLEIGGRHERATVLLGAAAGQLHVELDTGLLRGHKVVPKVMRPKPRRTAEATSSAFSSSDSTEVVRPTRSLRGAQALAEIANPPRYFNISGVTISTPAAVPTVQPAPPIFAASLLSHELVFLPRPDSGLDPSSSVARFKSAISLSAIPKASSALANAPNSPCTIVVLPCCDS